MTPPVAKKIINGILPAIKVTVIIAIVVFSISPMIYLHMTSPNIPEKETTHEFEFYKIVQDEDASLNVDAVLVYSELDEESQSLVSELTTENTNSREYNETQWEDAPSITDYDNVAVEKSDGRLYLFGTSTHEPITPPTTIKRMLIGASTVLTIVVGVFLLAAFVDVFWDIEKD